MQGDRTISLRIDADLYERLAEAALEEERSVSAQIRLVLRRELEPKPEPKEG